MAKRPSVDADEWWPEEREVYRPAEDLTPSQWADRYRVLSPLWSSEPGQWSTDRVPYLREVMDSIVDPDVSQITVKKSTQLGFTEALYNLLGYIVDQTPAPVLIVLPTDDDVEKIGEERLKVVFEETPQLRQHLTGRKRDWKKGVLGFARCRMHVVAATTPRALRSWPVKFVFGDELGGWPQWAGREAGPLDLAKQRQQTFYDAKTFVGSSPTTRANTLEKEFKASDKRRYWVPCPHCHAWQVLRWERIKWPEEITDPQEMLRKNAARYLCESCEKPIEDWHKDEMLRVGKWVPEGWPIDPATGAVTEGERSAHRGYHIWAGYSPWLTWSQIAAKWLESYRDPEKLANFVNNWLAEVWEERIEAPTKEGLARCIGTHHKDEVPDGAVLLTAGVDVQKNRAWYSIWAWGPNEESWLVRSGWVADLLQLDEIVFAGGYGRMSMPVRIACIDARHRRGDVVDIARRHRNVARAIVGVERDTPQLWSVNYVDVHPTTGAPLPYSLRIWSLTVGMMKDKLADHLRVGSQPGQHRAVHLHVDPGEDFLAHMESEHKVLVRSEAMRKARERWVLKEGRRANHLWDTAVYAFAAANLANVHMLMPRSAERAAAPRRPPVDPESDAPPPQRQQQQNQRRRAGARRASMSWRPFR